MPVVTNSLLVTSIEARQSFSRLLCYGVLSTMFWQMCSDASILSKALLMSAMLNLRKTLSGLFFVFTECFSSIHSVIFLP